MIPMSVTDFFLTIAGVLLGLGLISMLVGIIILATRVLGGEVKTIARQTAILAQKGIADEVAGLVGNASALVQALDQLVRTAAGVGVFLVILGMLLMAASYGIAVQLR
jgi:hypothetical protein